MMQRSRVKITYVPAKIWIRNFIRSHAFLVPLLGLILGMLMWMLLGNRLWFFILITFFLLVLFFYPFWKTNIQKKPDYLLYAKWRFWQIGLLHVFLGYALFQPKLPKLPVDLWQKNTLEMWVVDPLNNWVEIEGGCLCKASIKAEANLPSWKEGDCYEIPSSWVRNYQFSGLPGDVNWPQIMGSLGFSGIVRVNSNFGYKYLNNKDLGIFISWRFQVLRFCKQRLFGYFKERVAGLLWAMLFGDKSYISSEYIKQFNTGGLMHALAVSGMHVSLILGVLFWVFSGFGRRFAPGKLMLLVVVLAGWFYAAMAGNGAAIIRAVLSASWLWLGRYFFMRKVSALHVWFGTAYFQLLGCPYIIFQAGFILSYLAVLGLLVLYPLLKDFWSQSPWGWLNYLGDAMAMNVAATLFTLPVILGLFHSFPVWFLLGNLMLLPLLSGMVYLSIAVLLFGEMAVIGKWSIGLANQSVVFMDGLLGWLEQLPLPFLYGYDWYGVMLGLLVIWLSLLCFWIWSLQDPKRRWPWRLRKDSWLRLVVVGLFVLLGALRFSAYLREKDHVEFAANFQGRTVVGEKSHDSLTLRVRWAGKKVDGGNWQDWQGQDIHGQYRFGHSVTGQDWQRSGMRWQVNSGQIHLQQKGGWQKGHWQRGSWQGESGQTYIWQPGAKQHVKQLRPVIDSGFQRRLLEKLVVFQRRYGVKVVVFSNVL